MASCFDTLVGLSDKVCPCFEDGRPAGGATAETLQVWKHQIFESDGSPADPLVFTTTFNLPAALTTDNIQLFENGELLAITTDYTKTAARELSIDGPMSDATYQLWYLAGIPAISFVAAYDTSDSGLFISQLLPEEEIKGLVDCDRTVWDLFTEARTLAIKDLTASINANILRRHTLKRKSWNGFVGTSDLEGTLSSTSVYAGVRIRTNPVRSGYFRINRIMSIFSANTVIPVTIYAGDGTIMTPTFDLNTLNGKKAFTEVGVTLPMLGDFNDSQDYFIVFEIDPYNLPKLNKTYCSSCNGQKNITNVAHYDQNAEWDNTYQKGLGWQNWLIVGGWEGDSVSDFSGASDTLSTYMNGISLDIEVGCDVVAGLCGIATGTGPEMQAAAKYIQCRAASILVSKRASSSTPNRANFANREQLEKEAAGWEADAAEAITYLTQNANETMNDCVACKPRIRMGAIMT